MKKTFLYAIGLALVLILPASCGGGGGSSSYLFSQSSTTGTLRIIEQGGAEYFLTLTNVPLTQYLTEGADRQPESRETERFVNNWSSLFPQSDVAPVNAAFEAVSNGAQVVLAFGLSTPVYESETASVTYRATLLTSAQQFYDKAVPAAGLATELQNTQLFIDGTAGSDEVITFAAMPSSSGTISPSGTMVLSVPQERELSAEPADGYRFAYWETTGSAIVSQFNAMNTFVQLNGNATVRSIFVLKPVWVTLRVSTTPENTGRATPAGSTTLEAGKSKEINAFPAIGYRFVKWTVEGSAALADATSSSTIIILSGDATLTAVFERI